MIIRLPKFEDEKKISILIAKFREELKELKGIKSSINIEQGREEFKEYMEAKYPIFVVEDDRKELLGYLVCRIDDSVVWVESLFVSHDSRRRGVASKLYEKAETIATELGEDTVYNWVNPNNDKMISFLAKREYNVLNLIEIRKPWKDEALIQKINVSDHEYNY
ncbi:GNAT family N-acetyltransferase [Tissierella carlieri]|uniref:GNAT family N-acetyltransferase n=1 Tax=Tissierella carlieri TaxID=689904 RepID=A0ABT1SE62_9FIRM|nr:GNAT family N-acetyltransferase [Tissierella carlieri]MCQ4924682.1 GNAT family N-acetyltransferase [Tissierella carlieri]